jgi:DNA-binding Xre family transcriptional regulator
MTQRVRIYIATPNSGDEAIALQACEQYAKARGWAGYYTEGMTRAGIKSETFVRVSTPGEAISEVLGQLSGGDVLLVPSISHLGSKPSAVQEVLSKVIAKGTQLHAIDLGGRAEGHLLGIFAGLATAQSLETELTSLEADYAAEVARHTEEMETFREDLMMKFLREGVTVVAPQSANGNGHAALTSDQAPGVEHPPGVELQHQESPGVQVKSLRAKKNMSLQQLSDASGVSKSQLHRIEKGEPVSDQDMAAVLQALGAEAPQGAILSGNTEGKSNLGTLPPAEPA